MPVMYLILYVVCFLVIIGCIISICLDPISDKRKMRKWYQKLAKDKTLRHLYFENLRLWDKVIEAENNYYDSAGNKDLRNKITQAENAYWTQYKVFTDYKKKNRIEQWVRKED